MLAAQPKSFTQFFSVKTRAGASGICIFAFGTVTLFAQRPLGVDVSHYDGGIDWNAVKSSGIVFAWAKATEGVGYSDPTFTANITGAKAAGVVMGAYHFAHPELNSPTNEADHFWTVAGGYIKSDGLSVQPMLDYETFTASNGIPVGAVSYAAWANLWCIAVRNKAAAAGVSLTPVIYTSTCEAGNLNSSVAQWPSWIANPSGLNPQTNSAWDITSCTNSSYEVWGQNVWTVWQYSWTGNVPGISGNCDLDVFNGTSNQLVSTLVIGTNPPPVTVALASPLHRAIDTGGTASFSANAVGTLPLSYQWRLNGTNIPTATNGSIAIASAQTNQSGFYTVLVTNATGSVTSSAISLLVFPQQATVFADNFDANTAANWTYNTSSGDNAVVFNFDYSKLGISSAPNSTNGSTRGLQMQANLSAGAVAAVSLSPTNQNFSGDYRVRFDGWINVNGPFPAGGLGSTEYLTAGVGTSGTRVEWTGNAAADGYYFSADGDGGSSDTAVNTADYNAYLGATGQAVATGDYWAGTGLTARGNGNFYYTSAFPNGQAAPAAQQSAYPQQSGNLNPGTLGLAWHDFIVAKRGSTVDWVIDGIRIATISNATFTASNVFIGFWDPFASLSSNNVINFGLVDNVRVEAPAFAPSFTLQPVAQTVSLGTNVSFFAVAAGLPVPNYQWRLNGTNILNATNASYALAFVAGTNAGNYSVLASNVIGSVVSSNALLALRAPGAAQFQSIAMLNGTVQISLTGDAYWTYTVEFSTNLLSWSALTNLTSPSGQFQFTAGSVTNAARQFFRARVGP